MSEIRYLRMEDVYRLLSACNGRKPQVMKYCLAHMDSCHVVHLSVRELAAAAGVAPMTVIAAFDAMEKQNLISRSDGRYTLLIHDEKGENEYE